MKQKKQVVILILSVLFLCIASCKSSPSQTEQSEEVEIKSMLKTFYINYINMNSGGAFNKSDSLLNLYCTEKLIKRINGLFSEPPGKIDADIFLQTQMIDVRMSNNIVIKKDTERANIYYVSYTYGSTSPISVKLSVIKEKDSYKIDDVLIPGVDE